VGSVWSTEDFQEQQTKGPHSCKKNASKLRVKKGGIPQRVMLMLTGDEIYDIQRKHDGVGKM